MRLWLVPLACLAIPAVAAAQSPPPCLTLKPGPAWTCVRGGWVPPSHPLIDALPPSAADCDPWPNPYAEPDRATRCAAWTQAQLPPPPPNVFVVGRVYAMPYGDRAIVLGVSLGLSGVPVITLEWVPSPSAVTFPVGTPFSFRLDQQPFPLTEVVR